MKHFALSALVLLPVAAAAQSAHVLPAALVDSHAASVSVAAAPASAPAVNAIHTHQVIRAVVNADFANPMISNDPSLTVTFGGPASVEAPRLTSFHALDLSQDVLARVPAETKVAVRVLVDKAGVPQFPAVVQSVNPDVDKAAVAAVKQFRFRPAMVEHAPAEAQVTVEVKINKL